MEIKQKPIGANIYEPRYNYNRKSVFPLPKNLQPLNQYPRAYTLNNSVDWAENIFLSRHDSKNSDIDVLNKSLEL